MSKDLVRGAPAVLPEESWQRLPGETTKQYGWFIRYRDMPPTERSRRALAKAHGRNDSIFHTWSSAWRWPDRVKEWDAYVDQQAREAQIAAIREASGTRGRLVVEGLALLYDRLVGREPEVDENGEVIRDGVRPINPETIDAKDFAALGGLLAKMQSAAEEAAGVKPQDDRRFKLELAFDLNGPTASGSLPTAAWVRSTIDQPDDDDDEEPDAGVREPLRPFPSSGRGTGELPPGQPDAA